MFNIGMDDNGLVVVEGRLDAAQAPKAQEFLDQIPEQCAIDMSRLEYISSAGLGVLLRTHKRCAGAGHSLRLVNVSKHINDIFGYSGFDLLFDIEVADS